MVRHANQLANRQIKESVGSNLRRQGFHGEDGDMFIFYVKGKSWFQGIYQAVGDWHAPTVEWPDKSRGLPVSEINLKEIQLGFTSFRKLRQSLAFIESKKIRESILEEVHQVRQILQNPF